MKTIGRSLAAVAVTSMIGGQAFGQAATIMVAGAPIHKVPSEASESLKAPHVAVAAPAPVLQKAVLAATPPVEFNAPPNTLNAQLAALTAAPALAVTPG